MKARIRGARALLALAFALASCALAAVCLAACSGGNEAGDEASGQSGDTLRVGVRSDIMGFSHLNEKTGKYYGVEPDIANEMAKRMGYADVEFKTVTPDNRKQMLLDGEVDCIAACYSISDSRLESFDFSPSYYDDASVLVVQDSSMIDSVEELKGTVIGTMDGTNTAPQLVIKLAEEGITDGQALGKSEEEGVKVTAFDNFTLVQVASYQDLSTALERGRIDAMALDGAIAHTYMDYRRSAVPDFTIEDQHYGVATQKGSELSGKVSETIQGMLDDGTIDSLIAKWDLGGASDENL